MCLPVAELNGISIPRLALPERLFLLRPLELVLQFTVTMLKAISRESLTPTGSRLGVLVRVSLTATRQTPLLLVTVG